MKKNALQALGVAVGAGIYQVVVHGLRELDWYRVGLVGVFCFIVFSVLNKLKNRKP